MDILNNRFITNELIRGKVNIDEKTFNKFIVEYGDILFQRSSETPEDIGRSNVYLDDYIPSTFGGFVIRGKKIGNYVPMFFKYLLDSPISRKKVIKMGAGAQHYNIGQDGLEKIELFFPEISEQTKISLFLSKIDDRIAAQSKIISAIESQILTINHIMISKSLETTKLMNILKLEYKTNRKSGDGMKKGVYPFFTNEENQTKYLDCYDFDGEYIIANTGGKANFKYYNGKFAVMSDCLVLKALNPELSVFYYNVLKDKQGYINHIFFEGSGLKHLNKDWFSNLQLPIYNDNSKKYLLIIKKLREKLEKEKDMLLLYNKQKEYLLNNLFI